MPPRTPKQCRARGCAKTTVSSHGYCEAHADLANGWKRQSKGRTTTERGYGHAWRKRRAEVLRRDKWLCQVCKRNGRVTAAVEVDHIVNKAAGGGDDLANLQAVCSACHRDKTRLESQAGRGRG